MSSSILARVLVIVVAAAAVAWLAASLRAAELTQEGATLVERAQRGDITPREARHGRDQLHRARDFNADLDPRLQEGYLLLLTGKSAAARAIASEAVGEEPQNANAWYLVYLVAQARSDEGAADRARRELRALNPLAVTRPGPRRQ
jgi:opacity protein-like surface antigen